MYFSRLSYSSLVFLEAPASFEILPPQLGLLKVPHRHDQILGLWVVRGCDFHHTGHSSCGLSLHFPPPQLGLHDLVVVFVLQELGYATVLAIDQQFLGPLQLL